MNQLTEEWWAKLLRLALVVKDEAELDGRMHRGTNAPAAVSAWREFKRHVESRNGTPEMVPPAVQEVLGLCRPGDWAGDSILSNGRETLVCSNCSNEFTGHPARTLCKLCSTISLRSKDWVPDRVPRPRLTRLDGGLDDFDEYQGPEEIK